MKDAESALFAGPAKDKRLAGFVWRVHRYLEDEGQSPGVSLYDESTPHDYAHGFVRTRSKPGTVDVPGCWIFWRTSRNKNGTSGKAPGIIEAMAAIELLTEARITEGSAFRL